MIKEQQAAHMLEGKTLEGGWKVIRKITDEIQGKGSAYSCCYEVVSEQRRGFLKAFDYSPINKAGIADPEKEIQNILLAYQSEKEILETCGEKRLKNVIKLFTHGSYEVKEVQYPRVVYLILEYAEGGDIMEWLRKTDKIDDKLKSLHQLTKGLREIHKISIAHQDIKPTNAVVNTTTKLTDFGSAVSLFTPEYRLPNRQQKAISGSWEYAPVDLLYGYVNSNPINRRIGCDLYLLGSMIVFYFTNMSMNSLIKANLSEDLCWTNHANYNKFPEIEIYINDAFDKALADLELMIEPPSLKESIIFMVRCLCQPDSQKRGHPRTIALRGQNYDLERFLTIFSRLIYNLKS